jgi:acyl-homoserine lactone synthase
VIHIVTAANAYRYSAEMLQAFELRHRVFVDEKGWAALRRPDGRETDQFDDEHAVHMLYIEAGAVLGYQRLLPTTRPHLLTEVYPQLCDGRAPSGPDIWEWTRYCVAAGRRERGRMLSPVAHALLTAIVEWGLCGGVSAIVIEMNPLWLLRLVQLHFKVTPLGLPLPVEGEETVAVIAHFDRRTLDRLTMTRPAVLVQGERAA